MKKKPIMIALIAMVVVALIAVVLKRFGIGDLLGGAVPH